MSRHTLEPWMRDNEMSLGHGSIDIRGDGVWIGSVNGDHFKPGERPSGSGFPGNNEAEANACRIVACVNACKGMIDPQAEIISLRRNAWGNLTPPEDVAAEQSETKPEA